MSILDALRVQKANQQSIADLAALPQNQIIRLAQMGQIPADVVPVVISEKARMAKESANLRAAAQAQGGIPTVIEQAMQVNAQAEAPQAPAAMPGQAPMQMPAQGAMPPAMPQGAPQDVGVAALPTGQMFQPQNFESGGIVAFNGEEGSFVETPGGLRVLREELQPAPGQGPSSLADFIAQYKAQTAGARTESPEEVAYREALKKGSMSPEDIKDQKYLRLLQAGLGIMGGESPYAFTNIGKGSQEALKGYAEDVRSQQAQKMAELRAAAESSKAKRAEELQDVAGGSQLYGQYLDRELRREIARDSQLGVKYAENYLATRRAGGDKRPDEVIKNEGYNEFFARYGYAAARTEQTAATAAAGQAVTQAGQTQRARSDAIREWNDLKLSDPLKREYNRLATQDRENAKTGNPTTLAEDFKNRQIGLMEQRILGPSAEATQKPARAGTAPAAAQPPAGRTKPDISKIQGAPAGSTIGAFVEGKGWEVKDKNGKLLGHAQ